VWGSHYTANHPCNITLRIPLHMLLRGMYALLSRLARWTEVSMHRFNHPGSQVTGKGASAFAPLGSSCSRIQPHVRPSSFLQYVLLFISRSLSPSLFYSWSRREGHIQLMIHPLPSYGRGRSMPPSRMS
jgi:hypothetical protein